MCGYDPFYWYEKDLDEEYRERTGYGLDPINKQGAGTNLLRNNSRNDRQKTTKENYKRT